MHYEISIQAVIIFKRNKTSSKRSTKCLDSKTYFQRRKCRPLGSTILLNILNSSQAKNSASCISMNVNVENMHSKENHRVIRNIVRKYLDVIFGAEILRHTCFFMYSIFFLGILQSTSLTKQLSWVIIIICLWNRTFFVNSTLSSLVNILICNQVLRQLFGFSHVFTELQTQHYDKHI